MKCLAIYEKITSSKAARKEAAETLKDMNSIRSHIYIYSEPLGETTEYTTVLWDTYDSICLIIPQKVLKGKDLARLRNILCPLRKCWQRTSTSFIWQPQYVYVNYGTRLLQAQQYVCSALSPGSKLQQPNCKSEPSRVWNMDYNSFTSNDGITDRLKNPGF
jgi:hypothetical protein